MKKNKLGIYIHIPFCTSKCLYCDFNSSTASEDIIKKYVKALKIEIDLYGKRYKESEVDSVFIGGGTPSSIESSYIAEILKTLRKSFKVSGNCEITLEGNPNSLTMDKLTVYKNSGITRLSIGAQTFLEDELKAIGRIHSPLEIESAVQNARNAGFSNINLDLMFGLPLQNLESFKYSLMKAISLDLEHISCYSLILEEGTPLNDIYEGGRDLSLPREDEERNMYDLCVEFLEDEGYVQYEISNFSKIGKECIHNLKYWNSENYLGLGLGSHGRFDEVRYSNCDNLHEYIEFLKNNELPIFGEEILSKVDALNEEIFMGLRINKGLDIKKIEGKFNINFMDKYKNEIDKNLQLGFIILQNDRLRLSKEGRNFSNLIELDFYRLEP